MLDKVSTLENEKANTEYVDTELQEIKDQVENISTTEVSSTEPTEENVNFWINPEGNSEFDVPEINDNEINNTDTWSSNKINTEIDKLSEEIDNLKAGGIVVVQDGSTLTIEGSGD